MSPDSIKLVFQWGGISEKNVNRKNNFKLSCDRKKSTAAKWINLEIIILSEIRQRKADIVSFICKH